MSWLTFVLCEFEYQFSFKVSAILVFPACVLPRNQFETTQYSTVQFSKLCYINSGGFHTWVTWGVAWSSYTNGKIAFCSSLFSVPLPMHSRCEGVGAASLLPLLSAGPGLWQDSPSVSRVPPLITLGQSEADRIPYHSHPC